VTEYITVSEIDVDFDYETMVATITGKLTASSYAITGAVSIFPLFSYGSYTWQPCVPAVANQTDGWDADPSGQDFTYYWDFRDVVPSGGTEMNVAVAVTAHSDGVGETIPEHYGEDPSTNFSLVTVGPEQSTPVADQGDEDLVVVEAIQIVEYVLSDRDSQSCNVTMEYSVDGGDTWNECTEGAGGDGTENLTTSPAGVGHTFAWDTLADSVRGVKVLVRVTPYKQARPSPVVHADYRFSDYLRAAWDFGTGGAAVAVPAGDSALPEMLYGESRGNRELEYAGSVEQETSRLKLECDAGDAASIALPRHGVTGFGSISRAFMCDFRFDLGTAGKIVFDVVGAHDGRTLVRVTLSTVDDLEIQIFVGDASYTLTSTGATYAGSTEYNARLTLKPEDDGTVVVSFVVDGVPVSFDLTAAPDIVLPKSARLFNVPEIFVRVRAEGSNGTAAYVGRIVLLDDDQFTAPHAPPVDDDPRTGEWLNGDWWPVPVGEYFVGSSGNPSEYGTRPGQHGRAVALTGDLTIPNPTAGKRKWFRPDLFKNGFGMEFHALVSSGDLRVSLLDAAAILPHLDVFFGDSGVSVEFVEDGGGTTVVGFQDVGDPWVPDTEVWHHLRMSVRRGPNWVVSLSVDGSQPSYAAMDNSPQLFASTGETPPGYQLKASLSGFVGPVQCPDGLLAKR